MLVPHEPFQGINHISSFSRSGIHAISQLMARGWIDADQKVSDPVPMTSDAADAADSGSRRRPAGSTAPSDLNDRAEMPRGETGPQGPMGLQGPAGAMGRGIAQVAVAGGIRVLMADSRPGAAEEARDFIDKMVRLEEERFGSTLTVGLKKLEELFAKTGRGQYPDWKELAKLYDTFGTPRDLIRVAAEERGLSTFDEETFNQSFDLALQELQQAGSIGKTEQKTKTKPLYADLASRIQSLFRGYETTSVDDAKVLAIIRGDDEVGSAH